MLGAEPGHGDLPAPPPARHVRAAGGQQVHLQPHEDRQECQPETHRGVRVCVARPGRHSRKIVCLISRNG